MYQKPNSGLGKVRRSAQERNAALDRAFGEEMAARRRRGIAAAMTQVAGAPKRDAAGRLRDRKGHFVKSAY